jgi:calcineurin-like phosphoesterase family protein
MSLFFTSDLHFGHKNILRFCSDRIDWLQMPIDKLELKMAFDNKDVNLLTKYTDIHGECMISAWNKVVSNSDDVYILGDFSFRNEDEVARVVEKLNGKLHLVKGNHDRTYKKNPGFVSISEYKEIKINKRKIIMMHYPIYNWKYMDSGSWHLHGHMHGYPTPIFGKIMDVGVDSTKKIVVSYDEVDSFMETKKVASHL